MVGYSGGKDSTAVLQLVGNALLGVPPEQRQKKPVHVITTDTLVESPVVTRWVAASHAQMRAAAERDQLDLTPHMLLPEMDDTFWVNLIGRGYPAPRHKFRWCTERLKINPSNHFIRDVVRRSGEAILLLGIRKAESSRRSASMREHAQGRVRDRLSPNGKLPNSLVYSPIEDWTSQDVWMYLSQSPNPWGVSNLALRSMYKAASEDNECPLVVDNTTPTCGTSRFGCWVCTMVDRDRSMEAMIHNDDEKEWMRPLLDLRNELDLDDDHDRREFRRMNGKVQLHQGRPIHGPYTRKWREHWLRRVLRVQGEVRKDAPSEYSDIMLIRIEELHEIRRIWRVDKHEFDDSLPRIYQEEVGAPFPRMGEDGDGPGELEWSLIDKACGGDAALQALVARLLSVEAQHRLQLRRVGVLDDLEQVLQVWTLQDRDTAVAEAGLRDRLLRGSLDEQIDALSSVEPAEPT